MEEVKEPIIESSWAWRSLPSWFVELWNVWILVVFFLIRVLGSRAAHYLLSWYRHSR